MHRNKRATSIPENELVFRLSRSSGPGGQNVNKVNTKVTLFFDVIHSSALTGTEKRRILDKLPTRADKDGVIRVVSQRQRSQKANRTAAVERLQQLLTTALKTKPVRKKTGPTRAAVRRRLENKKKRSLLKQERTAKFDTEQAN